MDNIKVQKVVIAVGVLLAIFLAAKTIAEIKAWPAAGKTQPYANVITVTGKGEVLATPDIAKFSFGVTEEASTVAIAQKNATDSMNKILDFIKKSGVEDKDIKTTTYNIYPRYDYVSNASGYGGRQVLGAYVVSQMVEVKVRDIAKAGDLLSGIGEFGATDVSGLSFVQDDQDVLMRQARDLAVEDARTQAKALAKSLGVRLGKITGYYENQGYPTPVYYGREMSATLGMGGDGMVKNQAAAVPGGENEIISNVSITYEIK